MKNVNKVLIVLLTLLHGCSSDTVNEQKENDNDNLKKLRLVSKIKSLNLKPWEKYGDTLIYKDKKLRFSLLEGQSYQIQFYEYNQNGKISTIYHRGDLNRNEFNPNTFDIAAYKVSEDIDIETYIYENDVISERHRGRYIHYFTYDEQNRVKSVDQFDTIGQSFYEIWVFNYNGDKLESIRRNNLETGKTTIYTYEFDDMVNPFYALKEEFGLVELETSRALYYNSVDGMIFKNNVKKRFENGELTYSADFEYDGGYPIRISWTYYKLNKSNVENYSYRD